MAHVSPYRSNPVVRYMGRCINAVVRLTLFVAESIAFLLGLHFMLILHLVRLITANPIEQVRQTASLTREGAVTPVTATNISLPIRTTANQQTDQRRASRDFLLDRDRPEDRTVADWHARKFNLRDQFEHITDLLTEQICQLIVTMANDVEARAGLTGRLLARIRRCDQPIQHTLGAKLPLEIIEHILLLAAMPGSPHGVPTKIALLSKYTYRLVTPRMYANIHLTDPVNFRRFRMTLAVHNPALGEHVCSLSIASSRFDVEGYFPDRVTEHATLGRGIEQILLAAPNMQHLYLDLLSLAALHSGTASRLEKGALPISLTTEISLPEYLTLPTFVHLKHIEFNVFGLDTDAVYSVRQVLPTLHSLTVRWVTRRGRTSLRGQDLSKASDAHGSLSASQAAWLDDQDDDDLDPEERMAWADGGWRRNDFLVFVEALETLRRWPFTTDDSANGTRLKAVSVLAWPKAYRELRKYYASRGENVVIDGLSHDVHSPGFWNQSLPASSCSTFESSRIASQRQRSFTPPSRVRPGLAYFDTTPRPMPDARSPLHNADGMSSSNDLPPAPLRIGVDESHALGPRRGPLKDWCARRRAVVWPA